LPQRLRPCGASSNNNRCSCNQNDDEPIADHDYLSPQKKKTDDFTASLSFPTIWMFSGFSTGPIPAVDSAIPYGPADCGNKKCAEKDGLDIRFIFWMGKLNRDSE
jgi:hypothetical protein